MPAEKSDAVNSRIFAVSKVICGGLWGIRWGTWPVLCVGGGSGIAIPGSTHPRKANLKTPQICPPQAHDRLPLFAPSYTSVYSQKKNVNGVRARTRDLMFFFCELA